MAYHLALGSGPASAALVLGSQGWPGVGSTPGSVPPARLAAREADGILLWRRLRGDEPPRPPPTACAARATCPVGAGTRGDLHLLRDAWTVSTRPDPTSGATPSSLEDPAVAFLRLRQGSPPGRAPVRLHGYRRPPSRPATSRDVPHPFERRPSSDSRPSDPEAVGGIRPSPGAGRGARRAHGLRSPAPFPAPRAPRPVPAAHVAARR